MQNDPIIFDLFRSHSGAILSHPNGDSRIFFRLSINAMKLHQTTLNSQNHEKGQQKLVKAIIHFWSLLFQRYPAPFRPTDRIHSLLRPFYRHKTAIKACLFPPRCFRSPFLPLHQNRLDKRLPTHENHQARRTRVFSRASRVSRIQKKAHFRVFRAFRGHKKQVPCLSVPSVQRPCRVSRSLPLGSPRQPLPPCNLLAMFQQCSFGTLPACAKRPIRGWNTMSPAPCIPRCPFY
jgi:hypothetical protein